MPYLASDRHELPYASESDTSRDAAVKAQRFVAKQGIEVLGWFMQCGERGGTQKECHMETGIERSSICARVNALEKVGNLVKTEERRGGCAVYLAKV
jgi:hypothetical protein